MRNAPLIVALCALVLALAGWYMLSSSEGGPTEVGGVGRTAVVEGDDAVARQDATAADRADQGSTGERSGVEVQPQPIAGAGPDAAPAETRGPALTGRVVTVGGAPVAGARVVAAGADFLPLDYFDEGAEAWGMRWNTLSASDGSFTLRGPSPGGLRVGVWAPGFAPLERSNLQLAGGAGTNLGDLVLDEGVTLSGAVSFENGTPAAGAKLYAEQIGPESGFRMQLDPDARRPLAVADELGAFRIDTLAAGPWKLLVTSPNAPDHTFEGTVQAPGGHDAGLSFVLTRGADISGRVVDLPTPRPEGLVVVAQRESNRGWGPAPDARTADIAADGSYLVTGCMPDEQYSVQVALPTEGRGGPFRRNGPPRSDVRTVPAGAAGVVLTYKPASGLTFRVQDPSGAPLEELTVKAGRGFMIHHSRDGERVTEYPGGVVLMDELPNMQGGRDQDFEVSVYAPGFMPLVRPVELPADGGLVDLGVLVLEPAPVLTVRVRDRKTGAPVADARVRLTVQSADAMVGEYEVFSSRGAVSIGGDDQSRTARTDAEGVARITSFEGELGDVVVTHAEHARGEVTGVSMPPGQAVTVELDLGVGGRVEVTARDAAGAVMPGVRIETRRPPQQDLADERAGYMRSVAFTSSSGGGERRDVTNDQGVAVFEHLEPGAHQFRIAEASAGGGFIVFDSVGAGEEQTGWQEVVVGEGETALLELRDTPRAALSGVVLEGGRPLAGARVTLHDARASDDPMRMWRMGSSGAGSTTTDGAGRFQIERVAPGEYDLVVEHATRVMSHDQTLTVVQGDNEVRIDLPIGIVEGRVTDQEGQPVMGAKVTVDRAADGVAGQVVSMFVTDSGSSISVGGDLADPTVTNANGEYVLRGVACEIELVVAAEHSGSAPAASEAFEVAPGSVERGVDLVLEAAGTAEITLTGAPNESFFFVSAIYLDGGGVDPASTTLMGDSGELTGLRSGRWRFSLRELGGSGPPATREDWNVEATVVAGEVLPVAFTY